MKVGRRSGVKLTPFRCRSPRLYETIWQIEEDGESQHSSEVIAMTRSKFMGIFVLSSVDKGILDMNQQVLSSAGAPSGVLGKQLMNAGARRLALTCNTKESNEMFESDPDSESLLPKQVSHIEVHTLTQMSESHSRREKVKCTVLQAGTTTALNVFYVAGGCVYGFVATNRH